MNVVFLLLWFMTCEMYWGLGLCIHFHFIKVILCRNSYFKATGARETINLTYNLAWQLIWAAIQQQPFVSRSCHPQQKASLRSMSLLLLLFSKLPLSPSSSVSSSPSWRLLKAPGHEIFPAVQSCCDCGVNTPASGMKHFLPFFFLWYMIQFLQNVLQSLHLTEVTRCSEMVLRLPL